MSFSATPSFDPNVGTPATPAQSAGQSTGSGVALYDASGNAYDPAKGGPVGTYSWSSSPDEGTSYTFNPVANPVAGQQYFAGNGQNTTTYGAYDPSKYSSPQLAYLDQYGALNGHWGERSTAGVANALQNMGIDPAAALSSYQKGGADPNWMDSPQQMLDVIARNYSGPNAAALSKFTSSPDEINALNQTKNFDNDVYQSNHPRQSMTGMDYLMDVVIPVATMGLGAVGGAGALLEGSAALPEAGISSGMAEMFPEAGATFAGPGTAFTTGQAIQSAGEQLAKKAAMQALSGKKSSGFDPTGYIKPAGDILSTFADGGSVDDFTDFGGDTNDYSAPPDFSMPDVSSYGTPMPDFGNFDWSHAPSTNLGLVPGAQSNDPENQGTMGNMSGYDSHAEASPNAPAASDAHMPASATGASQSVIGAALQKLGYLNDKGDVNLGAALKAGATIASLAVTYLNNKKLASSGAQNAAAQVQPGQVFTLPNTALSNYQGAPYATGRPTNSNSVVNLRAHGGLMQHHLAMGGSPMTGSLGAPTGAMPPAMMPQGGMNRMPGASPQGPGGMPPPPGGMGGNPAQQPPQMPMGGQPAWQGVAPPPSAVPAPANHFAHGGALTQHYMGHGAIRGPGGGQDDIVDARMAPGEYVFDADTVAALGDGSSEEGARRLDAWRKHLREHKRSAPADKIPPKAHAAPHYLGGKT